jgi:hypothetical protein
MKTLRLWGMALIAVLVSVSFSACGDSDDEEDNGRGLQTTIEGTWYLKAEVWYGWKNGQPDMSNMTINKSYGDYANERIWVIKKNGDGISLTEDGEERTITKIGNNEYKKGRDRFVIKSVTSNSLVVDYYDNYYDEEDDYKEYGVYTFMK